MKKYLTNNIALKIASVVFAIMLWLIVLNVDDPTTTRVVYNIPVTSETGITLDDHTFDPGFKLNPSEHVLFNFFVIKLHFIIFNQRLI